MASTPRSRRAPLADRVPVEGTSQSRQIGGKRVTPTAWVSVFAVLVAVAGLALSLRYLRGMRQLGGILGTLALVTVIGWVAWYIGIQV